MPFVSGPNQRRDISVFLFGQYAAATTYHTSESTNVDAPQTLRKVLKSRKKTDAHDIKTKYDIAPGIGIVTVSENLKNEQICAAQL